MRNAYRLRILLAVVLSLITPALRADTAGPWLTLDAARRIAEQNNKLLLIFFYADWCGACKAMEHEVLTQPAVIDALQANYALVKVNADVLPDTARRCGVTALPTTAVMTADGQLVDKFQGRVEGGAYVARLSQVAANYRRPGAVVAQVPGPQPQGLAGPQGAAQPPYGIPATPPATPAARAENDRYADYYQRRDASMAAGPSGAPVGNPGGYGAAPALVGPAVGGMPPGNPAVAPPSGPIIGGPSGGPIAPAQPAYGANQNWSAGPAASPAVAPAANTAMTTAAPPGPAASAPPTLTAVGLDGYCPVALLEKQKWVPGDRRWGLVHQGRVYLFSGPEERDRFNADPERYAPVMAGNDVVLALEQGQTVTGHREHGVFYGKRVYLFSDEATLQRFSSNPARYADQALQALRSSAYPAATIR